MAVFASVSATAAPDPRDRIGANLRDWEPTVVPDGVAGAQLSVGAPVRVEILADHVNDALVERVRAAGARVVGHSRRFGRISARVRDAAALDRLARIPSIRLIERDFGAVTSAGSVTSRAVLAQAVDVVANGPGGLTGAGQLVGVLSDSFARTGGVRDANTMPGACNSDPVTLRSALPQRTGDLPATVRLLADDANRDGSACPVGDLSDEGAAMAELVHDIAPGAGIAFHTAFISQSDFAKGIDRLCDPAGVDADVIVDDVLYFNEPMYQRGIVGQAAEECVNAGKAFFSAAGNLADRAFRSDYRDVDTGSDDSGVRGDNGDDLHDWDPAGGTSDGYLRISVPAGASFTAVLQWNQPWLNLPQNPGNRGPLIDLDLYVLGAEDVTREASRLDTSRRDQRADSPSAGFDPWEIVEFSNDGSSKRDVYLAVDHVGGSRTIIPQSDSTPLEFRLVLFERGKLSSVEYLDDAGATGAPTLFGHVAAPGVLSTGAVGWFEVPPYDETELGSRHTDAEPFTSLGGELPIQFAPDGTFTGSTTNEPDLAAVDVNNTTFFGTTAGQAIRTRQDGEPADGFPNFLGSSAAAPNAAAVAALLRERAGGELDPDALAGVLKRTAIDVTGNRAAVGTDAVTGAGVVRAEAALQEFPSADAGSDRTVGPGDAVALDARASTDSGGATPGITSYRWRVVSSCPTATLTDAATPTASFTAPDRNGTMHVRLRVEDGDGLVDVDDLLVTVKGAAQGCSFGGSGGGGAIGPGVLVILGAWLGCRLHRRPYAGVLAGPGRRMSGTPGLSVRLDPRVSSSRSMRLLRWWIRWR